MSIPTSDVCSALTQAQDIVLMGKKSWRNRLVGRLPAMVSAVLLCMPPAQAADHPPGKWLTPAQANVAAPFLELGSLTSNQGEAKEAFLLRVARVLDNYAGTTQQEACSAIMVNQDHTQWQVRLITNLSHVACARVVFDEPGFTYSGATIHSHPKSEKKTYNDFTVVVINEIDTRLVGGLECGKRLAVEDDKFSLLDRENGEGYLVSRGKLRYVKDYYAKAHVIGKVDRTLPVPDLVPPCRPKRPSTRA